MVLKESLRQSVKFNCGYSCNQKKANRSLLDGKLRMTISDDLLSDHRGQSLYNLCNKNYA
ncbi:hypothetical protein TYRP_006441 [Tyrophagus putrescentiae]|nr:hypothetical protein TYRP_006441 [Tyrophagus putrescentiae]